MNVTRIFSASLARRGPAMAGRRKQSCSMGNWFFAFTTWLACACLAVIGGSAACSSGDASPTAAAQTAPDPKCGQFPGYCGCFDMVVSDAGPIAACTPESQGPEAACCRDGTACTCHAKYAIACAFVYDICRCQPNGASVNGARPVAKCTPPPGDAGKLGRCCLNDKDPRASTRGLDCVCNVLDACPQEYTEVSECAPRAVPFVCFDGPVSTCAK